jgi:hypothetical protein
MVRKGREVTKQGRISMTTRTELIQAIGARYRGASRSAKQQILDEFVTLTGCHRKHAIRALSCERAAAVKGNGRKRIYDEATRQALIMLREAADRVCGKRLKVLVPMLVDAMERHGHLDLDPIVKDKVLAVSAATIDRMLAGTRLQIDGQRKRRKGIGAAIRRSIPVRTFADWGDPPPGFLEMDMVEHYNGPKIDGDYLHTLVLTDIASGWTECFAMRHRSQALVIDGLDRVTEDLPFPMLGVDSDNDSAFMTQDVFDYCKAHRLEQTRSRAYKKNDQAWVEQKNGAIVRRPVGYGRLSGTEATETLAQLYASSRLYINFFQPSFKLRSKTREGARVKKVYYAPATPCDRLIAHSAVDPTVKEKLAAQFRTLDPVRLLQQIRIAQQALSDIATYGPPAQQTAPTPSPLPTPIGEFLSSLSTAWKEGEVRPTHRKKSKAPRWWRTRVNPFADAWPVIEGWLTAEPSASANELMDRLAAMTPEVYGSKAQLRTLQRRVGEWRSERAKEMVLGSLRKASAKTAEHQ